MFLYCPKCDVEIFAIKGRPLTCHTCKGALVPVVNPSDKLAESAHGGLPPMPSTHESAPPLSTPSTLPMSKKSIAEQMQVTKTLPPLGYKIPDSLDELFAQGGSKLGHSAVSSYLSCPERARLTALRVARKKGTIEEMYQGPVELEALGYGTLMHALLAIRKIHGMAIALQWLAWLPNLGSATRMDAELLLRTWDYEFPLPEPFELLGVEVEVVTDIGDGKGGPLLRSVRYDELARRYAADGSLEVLSMEHKTMGAGARGARQYMSQMMTQVKLWNANPNLVQQYGRMAGVVIDALIKTKVPKAARIGPEFITPLMEQRITEYLRLPEQIRYPHNEDGGYPRMLHSCFGKYQPCNYVDLCLHGLVNLYEQTADHQTDPVEVAGD